MPRTDSLIVNLWDSGMWTPHGHQSQVLKDSPLCDLCVPTSLIEMAREYRNGTCLLALVSQLKNPTARNACWL